MKSRMTEGATRMRPAVVVWCVAIACRPSSAGPLIAAYAARARSDRPGLEFQPAPAARPQPPSSWSEEGAGARRRAPDTSRAPAQRDAAGYGSLDVAGLLHRGFCAGLRLGERG